MDEVRSYVRLDLGRHGLPRLTGYFISSLLMVLARTGSTAYGVLTDINARDMSAFSNRPFGVKRFQTIRHHGVDVAHGLVLLFGIGARALPSWVSKTRWNNLWGGLAVLRDDRCRSRSVLTLARFQCSRGRRLSSVLFGPVV
jgi:hypothetical protein